MTPSSSISSSNLTNQPVVIDNGSGVCKAGFAGNDSPRVVFPSYVGELKHTRMMPGGEFEGGEVFVGQKVQNHRGMFRIRYALEHGIVQNWKDMEQVWEHVYSKEMLNIQSEDHPVLLTEAALNPLANREKAAEVFFETFGAPALFVSPQAVLSLYASGRTTGVVLDVGDGVSHVIPVYESFVLSHAISRIDLAGRDVTQHLQQLLRRAGHYFATSSETEMVREIKEALCFVAYNPTKQEEQEPHYHHLTTNAIDPTNVYTLPDGHQLQLGPERFRAPEILFHPEILGREEPGVQEILVQSILKCDMDLRKTLFSQIVLAGGSTMFRGFGDRLLHEVRQRVPKDTKIRISAPPSRHFSTWAGGSILASLSTFKTMWIRKEEYEEHGASILHRKTL